MALTISAKEIDGIKSPRITIQTELPIPNAVYAPMIMLQTGINNGKLHTTCQITIAAASVNDLGTEKENWVSTGQGQMIYLSDLANLDPDLSDIGEQVVTLHMGLLDLIATINNTRKVL